MSYPSFINDSTLGGARTYLPRFTGINDGWDTAQAAAFYQGRADTTKKRRPLQEEVAFVILLMKSDVEELGLRRFAYGDSSQQARKRHTQERKR
jgi:hypothetical protein